MGRPPKPGRNAVAAVVTIHTGNKPPDFPEFLAAQQTFRESLKPKDLENRVFYSHCWRKHETQAKKWQIINSLSQPPESSKHSEPIVYWGDWLDLQAQGPIPWKAEIANGIQASSKVVLFIDFAFLTSYNCLQVCCADTP